MTTNRLLAFAVAAAALAGCDAQPKLYRVTGTVTFDGQPVPKGMVFFDPVAGSGTPGVQGSANVSDGKFDTAVEGQGVSGGKYTIRVAGFNGKAGNEAPLGAPLFDEYEFAKDLPATDSTLDIAVPKAGKRK